ncbi:MAG: ParA family protein [Gammaproteobacteria bacterium]|nr:ParA family protein [Gammaproteobacteria bacterium]MBT4658114.1 ParA family protein [Gammaproteobacteria bacterium]
MLSYLEALNIQGVTPEKLAGSFDQSELNHLDLGQCQLNPAGVRRLLKSHGVDYSPRIMAYTSLKGGTGKTTSSVTTAVRAVDYGFRPCILDLDSQGSASLALGVLPNEDDAVFVDVWQKPSEHIPQALRAHSTGVSILPSSLDNSLLDVQLVNPNAQKNAVRDVCSAIFENGFDLIVIDCPPSLGTAVISTICAANMVVIPTNSDQFSLKAVELTIQEIKAICETFGLPIPLVKVLYTKFDRRIRLAHDTLDLLSKRYPEQLIVPPIRTSSEYAKQLQVQKTVFSGRRKSVARDDYDSFIRALFQLRISDSPETSSPVENY